MDEIINIDEVCKFENREAYKNETKNCLHKIIADDKVDDNSRRNAITTLLVRLYDKLMESINKGQMTNGAINDDAIEGILAIADTSIEEQNEKRKRPDKVIKLEEDLYSILKDEDNLKAKVNAFYSLCTKHRRIKDYRKFRDLVNGPYNELSENEIFKIMQAYYLIQETANDFNSTEALKYWKEKISPIYKRLPAFTQIYTETVVLQCETSKEQEPALLLESERLIKGAIKMREYAKFYSTLGRIYCCKGDYDMAIEKVRLAIEAEDSYREDYISRINEYEALISRFQRKKDERELKEKTDKLANQAENIANQANEIKAELEKSKTNYINILGFFSGIMALIIGAIDVTKQAVSMIDSLPLLIGIAGMIIMSFGSLNLMLVRKDEKRTNKYPDWMLIMIGGFVFVLSFLVRVVYKYMETNNWI